MLWAEALLKIGEEHGRPGTPLAPQGLCCHSTATAGATARQVRDYFNRPKSAGQTSAHFVVDWTEALVLIPWGPGHAEIGWGAGPMANARFLHLEACEPADGPEAAVQFLRCYARWIAAASTVLEAYGWPCDDAHVWSHARVSMLWRETDHHDPLPWLAHWGKTWDGAMQDLTAEMAKNPSA